LEVAVGAPTHGSLWNSAPGWGIQGLLWEDDAGPAKRWETSPEILKKCCQNHDYTIQKQLNHF